MNAKELLKEHPDTEEYYECSDSEAFLDEDDAKAHALHFVRTYEKVVVDQESTPRPEKDQIDQIIDRIEQRLQKQRDEERAKLNTAFENGIGSGPDDGDAKGEPGDSNENESESDIKGKAKKA